MAMTADECRARFASARSLRLATADALGEPHIVPATFALTGDVIVIAVDHKPKRHANLKRLANIRENPAVTLLVDHFEEDWERLWWVRADGRAQVLENELAHALVDSLVNKYEQYRDRRPGGPVIRIEVSRWSGWVARRQ
ncbi:TIGR03668 family PPOX class F420-dependent oxidoreductase [Streptomyces sp. NPDC096310]|uniref:TIGR03668 family PPOX class F420-dependent oxidoreductase n=1 Tax=Streptomyces sp. NPDC096310 TaxID=3366082 RepID=UPI0038294317